jgi:CBS domain-containing protein
MSARAACRLEQLGFEKIYDYVGGIVDWKAAGLPVEGSDKPSLRVVDATKEDVPTCDVGENVREVRDRARAAGWETCVVVAGDGVVVGRLRSPAWDSELEVTVGEVMEPGPSTVRPDASLKSLVARMQKKETPQVLVTTPEGILVGVLFSEDAVRLVGTDTGQVVGEGA